MLQGGEIVIILLLALIVLGPRRLPELARRLGRWTAELRAAARDVRQGLEAEVAELKEVGDELKGFGDEIKSPFGELKEVADDVSGELEAAAEQRQAWVGPKPVSGPTPEEAMADLEEMERKTREGSDEETETEEEGGA